MESGRVFRWSGVVGVGATALLAWVGWLGWVPVAGRLLGRGGPTGVLTTTVLATTAWALLVLAALTRDAAREQRATRIATTATTPPEHRGLTEAERTVARFDRPELVGSRVHRRYTAIRDSGGDRALAAFLVAARSSVDRARAEALHGPVRALVRSLPALGLLAATAALGGGGGRTSLADASGIAVLALACGVLCHVLVAVAKAREERVAAEVDDWALAELARRMPSAASGSGGRSEVVDLR